MDSSTIPRASGIYKITCIPTGKFYIGSAINLLDRRKGHYGDLQRQEHCNQKLQRAWNKYGKDAFTFEVLELVLLPEMLTAREQHWFDTLRPAFNIAPVAGSSLGIKHTPEARARMGASHVGIKHTPEARAKIGAARRGKHREKLSPERRENLRALHLGNTYTLGRKLSEEHKHKLALVHTGRKNSPETIEKMRLAALGRPPVNAEARAKIGAACAKTLIFIAPDGTEQKVTGIRPFCEEHSLAISSIMQVARGKQRQHRGWTARFPDSDAG